MLSCSRMLRPLFVRHVRFCSGAADISAKPLKAKNKNKKNKKRNLQNAWTCITGFSRFTTLNDMEMIASTKSLTFERVLDESMLPSGVWIVKSNVENVKSMLESYKKNYHHAFGKINVEPVTDLSIYKTPSKFGIDGNTVLLYNVPRGIDYEELQYVFEDISLDQKGIRKLSSTKKHSSSYLLFCASNDDADLAMLRNDGMCLGGNHLHMFRYN